MLTTKELKKIEKFRKGSVIGTDCRNLIDKWLSLGLIQTGFKKVDGKLRETAIVTEYGEQMLRHEKIRSNGFKRYFHNLVLGV